MSKEKAEAKEKADVCEKCGRIRKPIIRPSDMLCPCGGRLVEKEVDK